MSKSLLVLSLLSLGLILAGYLTKATYQTSNQHQNLSSDHITYPVQNSQLYGTIVLKTSQGDKTLFVISHPYQENNIKVNNNAITLIKSTNVEFAEYSASSYQPYMFYRWQLLGKKLSYTLDISTVPCSCVAAVYFSNMPGYNAQGQPEPSEWGNYYCDANKVAGTFCPEMDVTQANLYAHATTPHTCSGNQGNYWPSCDRGGCGANTQNDNSKPFGPGSNFRINTYLPFRVQISFMRDSFNQLQKIQGTFIQGSNTYTYTPCNQNINYLKTFGEQLNRGMVLVPSLWGSKYDDITWLDGKTGCGGDCDYNINKFTFSDLRLDDI